MLSRELTENICPGFEALTELQNLFSSEAHNPSVKESRIIDASNRFFTVIPSIHPHVIRDEDDFKSKVQNALDGYVLFPNFQVYLTFEFVINISLCMFFSLMHDIFLSFSIVLVVIIPLYTL